MKRPYFSFIIFKNSCEIITFTKTCKLKFVRTGKDKIYLFYYKQELLKGTQIENCLLKKKLLKLKANKKLLFNNLFRKL